jgi:hypothetical protein
MKRLILMPLLALVLGAGFAIGSPGSAEAMGFPSYCDLVGIPYAQAEAAGDVVNAEYYWNYSASFCNWEYSWTTP